MLLSVCMIVKNEEKMLERTLVPLAKVADEVIVVDTGSTDGTRNVAISLGARVHEFPWIGDFSAARNESLKHAHGKFFMWVDADEYIREEDLLRLREVLETADRDIYALPIYECDPGEVNGTSSYFRFKVIRNHKGYHFERPINEQIRDKEGRDIVISPEAVKYLPDIKIFHWGNKLSASQMETKKKRNLELLSKALENEPNDLYYLFLMAQSYFTLNDYRKALDAYTKVVELAPRDSKAAPAHNKIGQIHMSEGRFEEALKAVEAALELEPENAESLNLKASVLMRLRQFTACEEVLKRILSLKIPEVSRMSVNRSHYTYLPNFLLGNIYFFSKRFKESREAFVKAYNYQPDPKIKAKIEQIDQIIGKGGEE